MGTKYLKTVLDEVKKMTVEDYNVLYESSLELEEINYDSISSLIPELTFSADIFKNGFTNYGFQNHLSYPLSFANNYLLDMQSIKTDSGSVKDDYSAELSNNFGKAA